MKARLLVGEAVADLRSQRWRTVLLIGSLATCLILLFGVESRVVQTRASLDAAIDAPGARLIRITAYDTAVQVYPPQIDALRSLSVARAVFAITAPEGARSRATPALGDGTVRWYEGLIPPQTASPPCRSAMAGPPAAASVGLPDAVGDLRTEHGMVSLGGLWAIPRELGFLSATVLVRACEGAPPMKELVIVVDDPQHLEAATAAGVALFSATDASKLTVRSEQHALDQQRSLLRIVEADSRALQRWVALALTAIATLLLGSYVVQRRSEFGRRRAIGATSSWVACLVLVEALVSALVACALGVTVALVAQRMLMPGGFSWAFAAGAACMTLAASALGAVIPAFLAASADPIREVRVP